MAPAQPFSSSALPRPPPGAGGDRLRARRQQARRRTALQSRPVHAGNRDGDTRLGLGQAGSRGARFRGTSGPASPPIAVLGRADLAADAPVRQLVIGRPRVPTWSPPEVLAGLGGRHNRLAPVT